MITDVTGYCPACGGESLMVIAHGNLVCRRLDCPRPTAASEILDDRETEHVVQLNEDTFSIVHPLIERVDNALLNCDLHSRLAEQSGPPRRPGRYRVYVADDNWEWTALNETTAGS